MKKKMISAKHVFIFAAMTVSLPLSRAAIPDEPWTGELKELTTQLSLTDPQVLEAQRLLKMIDGQARVDRERCADDPRALIPAAEQRQQMEDRYLESVLEPEQIGRYREVQEQRKRDWEFLYFREGLRLSVNQCVTVRAILDEYGRKRRTAREGMRGHGDGPRGHGNGDRGGGRMGGGSGLGMGGEGGMGGGMRGGRGDMGPGEGMRGDDEQIANAEEKQIREILTPTQKKMFKDVQKMIQQKRESFRKMFEPSRQQSKMDPGQ
jgi:hypothetical protein